jgi:ribulose-phosphate 3-epimerase
MSRHLTLEKLSASAPIIAPSMLKCDFSDLASEVRALDAAGSQVLHWDVMDGHFVPNLSYGPMVFAPLRKQTEQLFDAHLMISEPARYLESYLQAGCDAITFHVEAVSDPQELLMQIRDADCVAGLAINPGTPVEPIRKYLPACDLVLVMSVEPGFGGQKFMPVAIDKIRRLREWGGPQLVISVDGGISSETIGECARAGANLFVAGSSVFETDDYRVAIASQREIADRFRSSMSPQE